MKLHDPIPLIKPDRPGTLARVVSYDLDTKIAQIEFLGKTYFAKSAGENRLEPGEMVNFVGLPEPWAIKTEAGLPTRFDDLLSKVFKTHPACGFLRYCLRNRPKIKKYAVGLSQGPASENILNVACYDGIIRPLPVKWAGELKSSSAFPAGTVVLTCQVTENNWIVVGKALGRIILEPISLSFPETQIGDFSSSRICQVTTIDVESEITIFADGNFQIRTSEDGAWGFSGVLPKDGGNVQVRYWPNFPPGGQADSILFTAEGAADEELSVDGIAIQGPLEGYARVFYNLPEWTYINDWLSKTQELDPESPYFGFITEWRIKGNEGFAVMSDTDPGKFPYNAPGGYYWTRYDYDPDFVPEEPAIFVQRKTGVIELKIPPQAGPFSVVSNAEKLSAVDQFNGEPGECFTPIGGLTGAVEIEGHNFSLEFGFIPITPETGETKTETAVVKNGAKIKLQLDSGEPGSKRFYFNVQPDFS